MTDRTKKRVAIVGAGIVGVAVASYLQRAGHQAILVDPNGPGQGASFGNAGCLNPSSLVPIAGPDTFRRVPSYLRDPLGPLAIRWSYLPRLAPWLIRYGLAGTPGRIEQQARALKSLTWPAFDALMPLVRDAGADSLVRRTGILIVYRSDKAWEADARPWNIRRRYGVEWQELNAEELRQFDPNLARDLTRAKYVPNNGHTIDPAGLVVALANHVLKNGGEHVRAEVKGFALDGNRLRGLQTSTGEIPADAAVIAAGAHSKPLAACLGDKVPLETERGYHLMIRNPETMPRVPTTDAEFSVVATPMQHGLRMAGTVELAGLNAAPNWERSRMMLGRARKLLPGLAEDIAEDRLSMWMGHRPSLPDSLPVIGQSTGSPDVFYAFGHQHVGMTTAPYTGKVIAEIVSGRPAPIDLSPFRPDRF
ncbi:MAG TPA: FAD-dependent oxidoreductase [Pseudorhodoplanes sp.]|nr:FAD-dependent oxidoreductase [Pseudorhodoplanes sp.]